MQKRARDVLLRYCATRVRPLRGGSDREEPFCCARCAGSLGTLSYLEYHGDHFHGQCLGQLIDDPTLVFPPSISKPTRQLIEDARRRALEGRRGVRGGRVVPQR